jgi:hypothetical protein
MTERGSRISVLMLKQSVSSMTVFGSSPDGQ